MDTDTTDTIPTTSVLTTSPPTTIMGILKFKWGEIQNSDMNTTIYFLLIIIILLVVYIYKLKKEFSY